MQLTLFDTGLDLPVKYIPDFLPSSEADALFTHCKALAWQQNQIRMLGKVLPVPRLECMYGIDYASYLYSGSVDLKARPWTPALLEVRDFLATFSQIDFDVVIGNYYRNGRDSIGWHADNEPSMGYRPALASISLGATRRFSVKPKEKGSKATHYYLEHGSLLLMLPGCQSGEEFTSYPKTKSVYLNELT
jgi:alkylated DNA repair dioxygenase AlkB